MAEPAAAPVLVSATDRIAARASVSGTGVPAARAAAHCWRGVRAAGHHQAGRALNRANPPAASSRCIRVVIAGLQSSVRIRACCTRSSDRRPTP